MKKYELLIFDFDGTLVDTVEDIAYYANSVLADFGYEPRPVSWVQKSIGWGVHELLKGLAPGIGADDTTLEQAVELFKKRYRENPVRKTEAFQGVRPALEGPLSKIKKAVVTNKPHDITCQILDRLNLSLYFDKVIGMHAGFLPKPDPGATLHVIGSLGASAEKTVFIGDSGIDAAAAQNAGVDFAWVSYGYDRPENTVPAISFSSASQWPTLVAFDKPQS